VGVFEGFYIGNGCFLMENGCLGGIYIRNRGFEGVIHVKVGKMEFFERIYI
jgi:hypothetical protein